MGKTNIEWAEHTWSPITGCSHAGSPGCDRCYARRMARRLAGRFGYPEAPHHFDVTLHPDKLDVPLKRKKPTMYFICSMSDLFHRDVRPMFVHHVFEVMEKVPQHTFQVLTKRPKNMAWFVTDVYSQWRDWPLLNVWLGVSVENQDYLWRVEELLKCPATVHFVSLEPLLGPIDLADHLPRIIHDSYPSSTGPEFQGGVDWIIVGGESGPGARPMDPQWVRDIRDQCQAADVPFFFKSWGSAKPDVLEARRWLDAGWDPDGYTHGRLLDGCVWDEIPCAKDRE